MSRCASAVTAAAVLLLCAAQVHGLVNCQWQGPSASYDLTPLAGADITGSDESYTYIARVCGTASEPVCGQHNASFCQYGKAAPFTYVHTLAKWTATGGEWSACTDPTNCPLGGVQLHYSNGDPCAGGASRQTTFIVACGSGTNTQYAVVASGCQYAVVFTHTAGCGIGPSSSSGSSNPVAPSSTAAAPVGPIPYPCYWTDPSPNGLNYDLTNLFVAGDLADSESDYNYLLHFCSNVTESKCWSQGGNFCQYNKANGAYVHAISRWSQVSALQWGVCGDPAHCREGGVEVTLANGDRCAGGVPRNVTFQVACAEQGSQTTYTVEESVAAPCSYLVRMAHAAGCGFRPAPRPDDGGGGSNGGKIAGAVIGVLLGVALLGGAFYWYRYKYAPSRDSGLDTGLAPTGATGYQQQV